MSPSKAMILDAVDRPTLPVEVPEWGCTVYVRVMSGSERSDFENSIAGVGDNVDTHNIKAKLLIRCLADEKGDRLFANEDTDAMGSKSSVVLDRLFSEAQKLNKLRQEDIDALAKN